MSLKKQYLFVKKLEALYKTKQSLAMSLEMLAKNEPNGFLRRAFARVSDDIKEGSSLAVALEKTDILDEVYCKLIHIGEKTGKLDKVFEQILDLLDNLINLRQKIIAASVYPAGVFATFFLIALIFILVIVPMLINFMKTFNTDIPLFLNLFTMVANPFNCCCCMPVLVLLATIVVYIFLNIELFAVARGMFILYVPGFGRINKFGNLFSYIYTLKICYESGMSVFEAVELSTYNVSNEYMSNLFYEASESVKSGDTVSQALSKTRLFDFDMIDLIRIGEESGTLEESYQEIIKIINDKINATIAVMLAMMKPIGILMGLSMLISIFAGLGLLIFSVLMKVKAALPY